MRLELSCLRKKFQDEMLHKKFQKAPKSESPWRQQSWACYSKIKLTTSLELSYLRKKFQDEMLHKKFQKSTKKWKFLVSTKLSLLFKDIINYFSRTVMFAEKVLRWNVTKKKEEEKKWKSLAWIKLRLLFKDKIDYFSTVSF